MLVLWKASTKMFFIQVVSVYFVLLFLRGTVSENYLLVTTCLFHGLVSLIGVFFVFNTAKFTMDSFNKLTAFNVAVAGLNVSVCMFLGSLLYMDRDPFFAILIVSAIAYFIYRIYYSATIAAKAVDYDKPMWKRFVCALPLGIGTIIGGIIIVMDKPMPRRAV